MNSVLVGLFDTQAAAAEARSWLLAAGFPGASVSTGEGAEMTSASDGAGASPVHEGGIGHFFRSLFGGGEDETYSEAFRRGGHAVTVTATSESELDRAEQILNDAGAVDIDEKAQQWKAEGWTGGAAASVATAGTVLKEGATRTLQEVEEELKVGKRAVQRGGVRIFSRMTEVPVEETVRLREEHAEVHRRVVDRPATEADFAAFKEGSIEVREMGEEAVVSKSARVVGEVEVGTRVSEREETIHDTVRRTEVDVEPIEGGTSTASSPGYAGEIRTGTAGTSDAAAANRDPLSGEPGSHPVGTAVGASAGGMAAGAAVGTVAGPIGTVIGAAAGAIAGGLAGKGVAEKIDPTVPGKS